MSDETVVVPNPARADLTAGMMLRHAREATGLHVAALAVSMKVPVKKLEALEADRLDELPDAVFVRALAASVCRTLKVDAAPILSKLPQSVVPKLDKNDRGVSMPVQGAGFLAGNALLGFVSRPAALLVGVLLVAALAVVLFPEARNTVGIAEPAPAIPVQAAAPEPAADAKPAATVMAEKPAPIAEAPAAIPVAAAVAEQASAAVPLVAPVAATVTQQVVSSVAASAPASPGVPGMLAFKAKDRAWIRVSDSKGVVQFEKMLAAGERAEASGALPLSVIVGNVAATEMLVRGQPFNLEEVNKNNVARFEVK